MNKRFDRFSASCAYWMGHPVVFIAACIVCLVWAVSGPLFDYSDAWQLVVNTGTTVLTFLMLFVIQNSQNRDTLATNTKLDELIHSSNARNEVARVEEKTAEEIEAIRR